MKLTSSNPVIAHSAIRDGNRSVCEETATPTGAVFIIKCDVDRQNPITGKRTNQAISFSFCSVCSVFHLCSSSFSGLTEKYADLELGGLVIKSFKNAY